VALGEIRGQQRAVEQIGRMLAAGKLPHALLFAGPPGVGKATAARALALALVCERGTACGACEQCGKISAGIHPDFTVLRPQGAGSVIAIGEIRELAERLGYAPHEAPARVVVLEDADRLTLEAANAFLKTLEEPPARTHFVLCSAATDRLPVTILSRCQRVLFAPLAAADLIAILGAQGVAAERAQRVASLAGGSAARALVLAADGELERRRGRARALADAARSGSFKAAVDAASELAPLKDEIAPTLDLLALWYRDAALLATGAPAARLAHADDVDALAAEARPLGELARCAGAVLDAEKALLGYANTQLTLERLILALRPGA
jgi:DNA polymerase-3 subunit delta'